MDFAPGAPLEFGLVVERVPPPAPDPDDGRIGGAPCVTVAAGDEPLDGGDDAPFGRAGAFTVGDLTPPGIVTVGVGTWPGVVTVGVLMGLGVVTVGVRTGVGVVTVGVRTGLGVVTVGVVSLGVVTVGVLTGVVTVGVVSLGVVSDGVVTVGVTCTVVVTAGVVTVAVGTVTDGTVTDGTVSPDVTTETARATVVVTLGRPTVGRVAAVPASGWLMSTARPAAMLADMQIFRIAPLTDGGDETSVFLRPGNPDVLGNPDDQLKLGALLVDRLRIALLSAGQTRTAATPSLTDVDVLDASSTGRLATGGGGRG
jgi:hypothetical protein